MAAPASATVPAGEGGNPSSARRPGARELARRFLTLREGSIIVVTILAALYFSLKNDHFFTHANFVTLLPYFAPFAILAVGEVLLMVAGRDRPLDRVGLPVRAVHVLRVQRGGARAHAAA